MVILQQDGNDRVKRKSGSIRTDHLKHFLCPVLAENQNGCMHFRYGFNTETIIKVTHGNGLTVQQAYEQVKGNTGGKNADYIPYLANIDKNLFGISVCLLPDRA